MTDSSIRQIISDSKLFSGLPDEAIDFLAANATERQVDAGRVLFHYGESAEHFYLVVDGHLSLEVAAIEGPSLELQDLGPGHVAGWSWLIPPKKWKFQARARTPLRFVEFDGVAVLDKCEQDHTFGYELLKRFSGLMSERLQFARQKMMEAWKPAGFA